MYQWFYGKKISWKILICNIVHLQKINANEAAIFKLKILVIIKTKSEFLAALHLYDIDLPFSSFVRW